MAEWLRLGIEEPTVADLAAGTPTTSVYDVLTSASADGASVTQFTYDGTAYTLDQTDSSEQEFTFTEGSSVHHYSGGCAL